MYQTELTPEYIDHMGNDMRSCNMARQSFGKWKDESQPLDEKDISLIRYLAEGITASEKKELLEQMAECTNPEEMEKLARKLFPQKHWVPLAHNYISIRMEAPVPIARQVFKHKIGSLESEESRRYIKSIPKIFVPDYFAAAADNVKQGSSGQPHERSDEWIEKYKKLTRELVSTYEDMINDGVAPEEARFVLPQGTIVHWSWTASLMTFASFYNQRTDPHAQRQIRDLAYKVGDIIEPLYPYSWRALTGQL